LRYLSVKTPTTDVVENVVLRDKLSESEPLVDALGEVYEV